MLVVQLQSVDAEEEPDRQQQVSKDEVEYELKGIVVVVLLGDEDCHNADLAEDTDTAGNKK